MDPRNSYDLSRLRESMEWSQKEMEPFRRRYVESVELYAGHRYGQSDAPTTVLNGIKLAVDVYLRQLSASLPKALCITNNQKLKTASYELELAVNHLLKEITFGKTLRKAVKQALFGMGIIKCGITPRELHESQGWQKDAGIPYAECVPFEDWLHDMAATTMEEWDWCANSYRMPVDDVVDNPLFERKAREKLRGSTESDTSGVQKNKDRTSNLSTGNTATASEYRDHVTLWDVFLVKERKVLTFADEENSEVLRVTDWEGPEAGPYHVLNLCDVPGNILPSPPVDSLLEMHHLMNDLMVKLADQAERQKKVGVASGTAATDGTTDAIIRARDGEVINSPSPEAVKELTLGGIDQQSLGFLLQTKQLFSYMAGNLESMGGLSASADTLGAEKLLKASSSQMISEYQDLVLAFTKETITALGFYLYDDPFLELPLTKKIGNSNLSIPITWGADRREADFFEYSLDIQPYSLAPRSPAERVNTLMQLTTQVLMPMQQALTAEGARVKWEELLSIYARYTDLPELTDVLEFNGKPLDVKGQLGQERPLQSPVTSRETIRKSVPGEQQPAEQQIMQAMQQGANQNGAGPANG